MWATLSSLVADGCVLLKKDNWRENRGRTKRLLDVQSLTASRLSHVSSELSAIQIRIATPCVNLFTLTTRSVAYCSYTFHIWSRPRQSTWLWNDLWFSLSLWNGSSSVRLDRVCLWTAIFRSHHISIKMRYGLWLDHANIRTCINLNHSILAQLLCVFMSMCSGNLCWMLLHIQSLIMHCFPLIWQISTTVLF